MLTPGRCYRGSDEVVEAILLVLLLLVLVAAGVMFYLWRQVTSLPDWYTAEEVNAPAGDAKAAAPEGPPAWKDAAGAPGWEAQGLRNFHRRAAAKDPIVAKVIEASRASFEGGTWRWAWWPTCATSRTTRCGRPTASCSRRRLHNAFPSATNREIYIGVEDPAPLLVGGEIELGPQAQLVLGSLKYDLDAAAAKMGMSPAALRKQWTATARNLGVTAPSP